MKSFYQFFIIFIAAIGPMGAIAQKPLSLVNYYKYNLKDIETYRFNHKDIELGTNILRADYDVHYTNDKSTSPEGVAKDYLKSISSELGVFNDLRNIRIIKIIPSHTRTYVYFEQHLNNIPIFSSSSIVTVNKYNTVTALLNGFRRIEATNDFNVKPEVSAEDAVRTASNYINLRSETRQPPITELTIFESIDRGMELAWVVNISTLDPLGVWRIFINANDSRIIHVDDIASYSPINGQGMVFEPSPTKYTNNSYGDPGYTDNNNATSTELDAARISVTLQDITFEDNVYKLKGPYCVVENKEPPSLNIPELINPNAFNFTRNQPEFEAVMCYYHVDKAARRVEQLGYSNSSLMEISVDPHGLDGSISPGHYDPIGHYLGLGTYMVDGAEDGDIIWHEFAHILQHKIGSGITGTASETVALKEGSSDYWALSYSNSITQNQSLQWSTWHAHSPYFAGRDANVTWVYPNLLGKDDHENGQIGSVPSSVSGDLSFSS
ncbi:MAG: hypothetical protein R6V04_00055 [bacterium]